MVHHPLLLDHYFSIWRALPPNSFCVVFRELLDPGHPIHDPKLNHLSSALRAKGYEIRYESEVLSSGDRYKVVVSNHKGGGTHRTRWTLRNAKILLRWLLDRYFSQRRSQSIEKPEPADVKYGALKLGKIQVRMMYGADLYSLSKLPEWNSIYHLFLCHGPQDSAALSKRFRGVTIQVGLPQMDSFSEGAIPGERDPQRTRDNAKKNLLWLPTIDPQKQNWNSLGEFSWLFSQLQRSHNIICRPHPMSLETHADSINFLRKSGVHLDVDSQSSMSALIRSADFVLCDGGASPFTALYVGRRVILLESEQILLGPWVRGASNEVLRGVYPSIHPDTPVSEVERLLTSEEIWLESDLEADRLRPKVFLLAPGSAGSRVGAVLTFVLKSRLPPPLLKLVLLRNQSSLR